MTHYSQEKISWLRNELGKIERALIVQGEYDDNMNYYFVRPTAPNQPGSEWQFETTMNVNGWAEIRFDILKDGRLGGAEVWARREPERLIRSKRF